MSSTTAKPRLPRIPTGYVFTLLIASAVAAWRLPDVASMAAVMATVHSLSDAVSFATHVVPLVVTLLPFLVAAAAWRVLPTAMRTGVLGVLALLAAPTAYRAAGYAEALVTVAIEIRRAAADLAPIREAMRIPPEEAARRAVAGGSRELLAVANIGMSIPRVVNDCAADQQGWKVIRGTTDFVRSRGHWRFQLEAARYAARYNEELISLLALDRAELARYVPECFGYPVTLGVRRRYWPDGGLVE